MVLCGKILVSFKAVEFKAVLKYASEQQALLVAF
jgi:hypothetical protein